MSDIWKARELTLRLEGHSVAISHLGLLGGWGKKHTSELKSESYIVIGVDWPKTPILRPSNPVLTQIHAFKTLNSYYKIFVLEFIMLCILNYFNTYKLF